MVKGSAAEAAGLHYLEHESMELKTGDKTWRIYGSPVRLLYSMGFNFARLTWHRLPHDSCRAPSNTRKVPKPKVGRPWHFALVPD
jgi:hypothetical protein